MQFRLPTETEWEFAAKGGEKGHNYQYSGGNNLNEVAWNLNNSEGSTHPVKQKKANELGLYDMSGNVWEWCDDRCEEIIVSYQTTAVHSPRVSHPIKGGCWCETEKCKLTAREVWPPSYQGIAGLGIRLAMTI